MLPLIAAAIGDARLFVCTGGENEFVAFQKGRLVKHSAVAGNSCGEKQKKNKKRRRSWGWVEKEVVRVHEVLGGVLLCRAGASDVFPLVRGTFEVCV